MKMSKKRILILDGSNLAYRAYHSMKRMSYKGKGTGIQWGFLNILAGMLNRYNAKSIHVCWDSKGSNPLRVGLLPSYRQRDENKKRIDFNIEDFAYQREGAIKLLHSLGIPQLIEDHIEADDFIYELVRRATLKTNSRIIIGSGDKDFRQLVSDRVGIHDDKKGYITTLNFKKLFGIEPHQYADYLCLLGDSSDKIPGVRGIGEATALKMLQKYPNVPAFLNANPMDKMSDKIRAVYQINKQLINLPYFSQIHGPQKLHYYKGQRKPNFNIDEYYKLCSIFGINKFKENKFIDLIPYAHG